MRASTLLIAGAMSSAMTLLGAGTAAAQPATTMPGDGVYLVGVDIVPGIWESAGPVDPAHNCDWSRLWKLEGDNTNMSNIIGNNLTKLGPIRAEIEPTDLAFKSVNCGAWRLLPPKPPTGSAGR
ncbi:hypothetical protein [Nocardia sp. NPDC049149]|uniref:hypothetical protein n=1 Tax=Nocardia sp. NPDC049149 TaxID=3364315 RepID=UPI003717A201